MQTASFPAPTSGCWLHGGCIVGIPESQAAQLTTRAGGWFQLSNAFDADRFERLSTKTGAASWSVGMPNFAAIYALNAGLRYLGVIGVEAVTRVADPLTQALHAGLLARGISPMAPRRQPTDSGIVAFQHPRSDAIHAALQAENIHVMHCRPPSRGRARVQHRGRHHPLLEHTGPRTARASRGHAMTASTIDFPPGATATYPVYSSMPAAWPPCPAGALSAPAS